MTDIPDEILTQILSLLAPPIQATIFDPEELFGYDREPRECKEADDSLENYQKRFFTNPYRDLLPCSLVSRQFHRCSQDIIWSAPNFGNSTHAFRAFVRELNDNPLLGRKVHKIFLPNLHIHDGGVYYGRVESTSPFDRVPFFYIGQGTQAAYDEEGSLGFLLKQCPNLLAVHSTADRYTNAALQEHHFRLLPLDQMQELSCSGNFSTRTVEILANSCTSLRKLGLPDIFHMSVRPSRRSTVPHRFKLHLINARSPEEFAVLVSQSLRSELQQMSVQEDEEDEMGGGADFDSLIRNLAHLLRTNSVTLTHLSLDSSRWFVDLSHWDHLVTGISSLRCLRYLSFTGFRKLPVSFFSVTAPALYNLRVLDLDGTNPCGPSGTAGLAHLLGSCPQLMYLSLRWTLLSTRAVIQSAAENCPNIRYLAVCCDEKDDILSSSKTTLHAKYVVSCFAKNASKLERLWLWDETVGKKTLWRLTRADMFPRLRGLNVTVKWSKEKRLKKKWDRRVAGRKVWFSYMPL